MATKIRPMRGDDLESLAEIYVETYKVFDIGERWDKKSAYKLLEHWFKRQSDLAFVVEYNDEIVGAFVTAVKPWWDGNHLTEGEIFVHPDHQRRGLGTELIKRVFKTARDKYKAVAWDAFAPNKFKHPLNWYKEMGFKEVKEWTIITCNIEEILKKLG